MMPSGSACMTPGPPSPSARRRICFSAAGCFACPPAGSTGCEAYKVGQLQSYRLRASEAFYHATLGGARALRLEEKIGNFQPGKEADFVVIDPAVTPLQRLRIGRCHDIYEQLFVLMTLGDERNISETWVNGERVWCQD